MEVRYALSRFSFVLVLVIGKDVMKIESEIQRISNLIFRSMHSTLSDEERQELARWREKQPRNEEFYKKLTEQHFSAAEYERYKQALSTDDWGVLQKKLRARNNSMLSFGWCLRYAAILIIAMVAAYILWQPREEVNVPEMIVAGYVTPDANVRAVLELENGETIKIEKDQVSDGTRLKALGIVQDRSALVYVEKDTVRVENHVLRVPRGGEYMLILSDDTKVWLNSESVLRYPSYFAGNERRVYIEGEAYFQVAKDASSPFIVESMGMDIRVTGTEFNVMAYKEKDRVETTLVEGSVVVNAGGQVVEMSPNMQAVFSKNNGRLITRNVRAELFYSWKNGVFEFDDLPLREIVEQLGRWYNVDFVFEDASLADIRFTGAAEKLKPITFILDLVKDTKVMNYQIEGNTIRIKKK